MTDTTTVDDPLPGQLTFDDLERELAEDGQEGVPDARVTRAG